jgi:membrane protein required for colicin V production
MAGWNYLDYAIAGIIVLGVLYGLGRGALRMATSILSLIAGIVAASSWHPQAGVLIQQHFATSPMVSSVLGYLAVFVVVAVAIEIAGRRIIMLTELVNLGWIDRLGGALFGAALAAVFAGIDVALLTTFLPPDSRLLHDSQLAPRMLAYNQTVLTYVPPEVMKAYQQKRDDFLRYWNDHKQNPAGSSTQTTSGT